MLVLVVCTRWMYQYWYWYSVHLLNVPVLVLVQCALAECTSTGTGTVCTRWMYQYCVLRIDLRTVLWTKTCHQVFNINYQYKLCFWLNKLLYYCKTQRDGSYQNWCGKPKHVAVSNKNQICKIYTTVFIVQHKITLYWLDILLNQHDAMLPRCVPVAVFCCSCYCSRSHRPSHSLVIPWRLTQVMCCTERRRVLRPATHCCHKIFNLISKPNEQLQGEWPMVTLSILIYHSMPSVRMSKQTNVY
jgi:hypothetical protein